MSFRRYEITLPTRYNDGRPVEPEQFLKTRFPCFFVFWQCNLPIV